MRLQSSHTKADRGLDAYWTPPEAVAALLRIEAGRIPQTIWEPAAGNGAIANPLRAAGHTVVASDIAYYGERSIQTPVDYLKTDHRPMHVEGVVTNPPFGVALEFARKAVGEVRYVALLLRTNFLESTKRLAFFREHPPARVWVSSRRLPLMHRNGWEGPRSASNTCFAWFVWDGQAERPVIDWFDWKEAA